MENEAWYDRLNRSPYTPPKWVFGPVWSLLYTCMAISCYLVWSSSACFPYCPALLPFFIQLALNLVWSPLFFRYRRIRLSFFVLLAMFAWTVVTCFTFYPISPLASYLLIPYLLWMMVASYLNFYIMRHN